MDDGFGRVFAQAAEAAGQKFIEAVDYMGDYLFGCLCQACEWMSEGLRNAAGRVGNTLQQYSPSNLMKSMKNSMSPNVPAGKSDPSPAKGISPDVTPAMPTKERDQRFSGLLESYGIERGNLGFQVADVGHSAWEGQAKLGMCATPRLQTAGIGF